MNRREFYTPTEAAGATGLNRRTIYRYLQHGKLTKIHPVPGSPTVLIPRFEVDRINKERNA